MKEEIFSQEIKSLFKLSDERAKLFARAGVVLLRDLLFHMPLRYEDRSRVVAIADVRDGDEVQIVARVERMQLQQGRRSICTISMQDGRGDSLRVVLFRYYPSQLKQFKQGRLALLYGKVGISAYGIDMAHPEITWLDNGSVPNLPDTWQAVYPTVKGLSQIYWRDLINRGLKMIDDEVDPLSHLGFVSFKEALVSLHQPPLVNSSLSLDEKNPAIARLVVEELCAQQLSMLQLRVHLRQLPAPVLPIESALRRDFLHQLPFQLTEAQARVAQEIAEDMQSKKAMLRLVQGDVGSGKTVIALLACLQAIAQGKQAVMMAPTELLAEQHFQNAQKLLQNLPVECVLLRSKQGAKEKRDVLWRIKNGQAQLIIGTHALFQDKVEYDDLAFIAIDEQHRFGVHQRLQLQQKARDGYALHRLILTATPIPRTLSMSAYGELDTSIIDALPKGRQAIRTTLLNQERRDALIARLAVVCKEGRQAYWVCPLIEESERLECENAEGIYDYLCDKLPHLRLALVHGRIDSSSRQEIMNAFSQGEIDILVATTVIEVGVDVANASLMVIENAERFGLSQLHQLRGRVGRGSVQSDCVLLYQAPLGKTAKRRLEIMYESNDGFRIAEEDLKIRGAGELLGTKQAGEALFKIAKIERDEALFIKAQQYAEDLQNQAPDFAKRLLKRWVGEKELYLEV